MLCFLNLMNLNLKDFFYKKIYKKNHPAASLKDYIDFLYALREKHHAARDPLGNIIDSSVFLEFIDNYVDLSVINGRKDIIINYGGSSFYTGTTSNYITSVRALKYRINSDKLIVLDSKIDSLYEYIDRDDIFTLELHKILKKKNTYDLIMEIEDKKKPVFQCFFDGKVKLKKAYLVTFKGYEDASFWYFSLFDKNNESFNLELGIELRRSIYKYINDEKVLMAYKNL